MIVIAAVPPGESYFALPVPLPVRVSASRRTSSVAYFVDVHAPCCSEGHCFWIRTKKYEYAPNGLIRFTCNQRVHSNCLHLINQKHTPTLCSRLCMSEFWNQSLIYCCHRNARPCTSWSRISKLHFNWRAAESAQTVVDCWQTNICNIGIPAADIPWIINSESSGTRRHCPGVSKVKPSWLVRSVSPELQSNSNKLFQFYPIIISSAAIHEYVSSQVLKRMHPTKWHVNRNSPCCICGINPISPFPHLL